MFVAACVPKHQIVKGPGIALGAALTTIDEGPYRVLFTGPRGASTTGAEVTLAFSRAVRADEAPASIVREADGRPVDGTWQWFGASVAIFRPTKRFAAASSYRVEPRALPALDGSEIDRTSLAPVGFTTDAPKLERVSYVYDEKTGKHLADVTFNQDVSRAAIAKSVRVEARGAATIPFRVVEPPPHDADDVGEVTRTLELDARVARLDDISIVATTALRGTEGPLPPTGETRLPIESAGAFKVQLRCATPDVEETSIVGVVPGTTPKCDTERDGIQLELTRTVAEKDLFRHLVVAAPAKPNPEQVKELSLKTASDTTTYFDLGSFLAVEPGKKYRVTLKAGLVATDKERLPNDQVIEFETTDRAPRLVTRDLRSFESVVELARPNIPLRFLATNVSSFEVVSAPLTEQDLGDVLFAPAKPSAWVRARPKSTTTTTDVKAAKNAIGEARVDIAKERAPGAWIMATHAQTKGVEDQTHIFSVTDLGVTTKWSPHGALVWITRLSNAEPVAGATISLRRIVPPSAMTEVFTTITDHEGIATVPANVVATFLPNAEAKAAPLFVVKHGADWTYAKPPELDASLLEPIGDVFVERGLYRPGESLLLKGYFRAPSPRGLVNLAGKTVTIEALDSAGHVFHAETATLDAFGAFSSAIAIPKTVRLGRASVRARIGPARGTRDWPVHDGFRIDAFRTPEFKVEAKTDRQALVRGETATLTTTGTYLLGAPMVGVAAEVYVSRQRSSFTPTGLEKFSVTAGPFAPKAPASSAPTKLEAKLDTSGHTRFSVPFPNGTAYAEPEGITFDVSIDDVSRAFVVGDSTGLLVHPSDVYLGVRANPSDATVIEGKTARVELAAAGIDGTRRSGMAVSVELFREVDKGPPVSTGRTCKLTTEASTFVGCDLAVEKTGRHWFKATSTDASQRVLIAASSFDVAPKTTKPAPRPVAPAPPATAMLSFEQACVDPRDSGFGVFSLEPRSRPAEVGQTTLVCLRTETGARRSLGLFTLEREGILRRDPLVRFDGASGKLVNVTLGSELFPNARAAFEEPIGRTGPFPSSGGDSNYPRLASGSAEIFVHAPAKTLSLAVETVKEARPGSEIELRVRVKDGLGLPAPSQVTLWAVDEGIDLLAPRHVPTPESTFAIERSSDVVATDTRKNIFHEEHDGGIGYRVKAPSVRMGSTSVGDARFIGRSVFRPTAFFLPNVVTDANGFATVKAKLPDNLTTWKVFAVAASVGDSFGGGETSFKTNKPLMIRPQLPRFLRTGDRFDGTVMLDSLSKQPLDAKLTIHASGVIATKATVQSLTIPPQGHIPVRFPIEASAVGQGKLVFEVSTAKGPSDQVTIEEVVQPIAALETVVVSGEIPRSGGPTTESKPLGDLGLARADVGGFDYRLSTTPLVGLAESLAGLVEYPYGCTEQLTSRLVPLIRLREMAHDLGVTLPANVEASVRSSLASLLSHQRDDGGFGFWQGSPKSEAWLTVLALGTLSTAEQHGYVVPASAIERARTWLEKPKADGTSVLDPGSRAMLEDVLAAAKKPRPAELRALAADPKLPLFGQALVARSLASIDATLARQLLDRIVVQARTSGADATFADEATLDPRAHLSSNARTTAMVLRAMLAIDPRGPLVTKTVRGLLSLRHDGRWLTTQDSAWALAALEDARALYRPAAGHTTAGLLLDRQRIAKTSFSGLPAGETRTGTIAMSRLLALPGAAVGIESDGERDLYYQGALHYARREPPASPLTHGITIARSLRPLGSDAVIRVGDYAIVDVAIVTATARDLVVVDDPIPAGFEAVNESFAAKDWGRPIVADPARGLTHRELRDDRVVSFFDALPVGVTVTRYALRAVAAGRFALPPAKAECMYAPDVFGRTASTWVETR
jgi:uncharacterized protein YfaS (alpha-2-macroglobulin family)